MNTSQYFPPKLGEAAYHCPFCNVYARQLYAQLTTSITVNIGELVAQQDNFDEYLPKDWVVTKCERCTNIAFWHGENLVFPKRSIAPPCNEDLDPEIQADYREAADVLSDSPRAAAALLRLALQKLCKQLGEKGANINTDIASLVSKGLNPYVQKALDALRITGNNAVHPGEIDLSEKPERVIPLFGLVNFIAEKTLTERRQIDLLYGQLPEDARKAVQQRDQGRSKT